MKKLVSSVLVSLSVLGASAQNMSVSGTYQEPFIAGTMCPAVAILQPKEGYMDMVEEIPVEKPDYQYTCKITSNNLINKILYVGYNGEFFPFYSKDGENLQINISGNYAAYSKKLCKENKALAGWYETIKALHHMVQDRKLPYAKTDSVSKIMDKAWKDSDAYIKKIKTGNQAFDEEAKFLLPRFFMYEALQVFSFGWCAPSYDQMPEYLKYIFEADNFNTPQVWNVPFTAQNILLHAFGKDIICGMKTGQTIEFAIQNISDPYVKEQYAVYGLENGMTTDPLKFIADHENLFITPELKERVAEVKRKNEVITPGHEWIDMEYEDAEGNLHKLSEHLGKVVVIDVWATWCAPCRAELPHLLSLEKEMEGKDVVFIGYSIDQDKEAWKTWLKEHEMSKVQLWTGGQGPIITDYKVDAVPQFLMFSKDGKLITKDAPRPSSPDLKALIEKNL